MNRKQFGILLVVLIVLGGAGWYVHQSHQRAGDSREQGVGENVLGAAFPVNDVAHINIKQGANEVNLEKKDDLWRVRERGDYQADFDGLSGFLRKARELKVVQTEQIGASQLERMELAPGTGSNSATVVTLFSKDDKPIQTLTLGKKHLHKATSQQQQSPMGGEGFPDGRYVLTGKDTRNVMLIGDPLSDIEANPDQWLDKSNFTVERPKAVAVTFAAATNSWKIERDTESGEWKLADAKADEKLDAVRVSDVSGPFASPKLESIVLPSVKPEEIGLDKPTVVTVNTFDDFIYTVKVGFKTNEHYSITMTVESNAPKVRPIGKDEKPEDKDKADKAWAQRQKDLDEKLKKLKHFENWTYLVPAFNVDPILKNRKDLLEEKKEEAKPAATAEPAPAGANAVEAPKPADAAAPAAK